MNPAISHDHYTIKTQSSSKGEKLCAYGMREQHGQFIEQESKWSAPFKTLI